MLITSKNVGRIAERIAMNELEARGFHIIDLAYMSKTSANVDFIASRDGNSFNVQVKGATNLFPSPSSRWWVQYGYCDVDAIEGRRKIFNRHSDFALMADVVILVAVKSPSKYRSIVLPIEVAEEVAQINMSGYYRLAKAGGGKRQPGKMWVHLEASSKPLKTNQSTEKERALLIRYEGAWDTLEAPNQ